MSCDHGLVFDEEAARKMLAAAPQPKNAIDFVMGNPAAIEVRKLWPRGYFTDTNPCPKGCDYRGIAYVSDAHYLMGDW